MSVWKWDPVSLGTVPKATRHVNNKLRLKPISLGTESATSSTVPFFIFLLPESFQEMKEKEEGGRKLEEEKAEKAKTIGNGWLLCFNGNNDGVP